MTDEARIVRIATARARNLEPWGKMRTLAGGKHQPVIGTDARMKDIRGAGRADKKAAGRELFRIWWYDGRVRRHTFRLAVKWRFGV